jgi:hypothetical protein
MARKIKELAPPTLRPADRARGEALLDAVNPNAPEDDPAFRRLLEWWDDLRMPSSLTPTLPAYHARGEWLTAGVGRVVAGIGAHLEASRRPTG